MLENLQARATRLESNRLPLAGYRARGLESETQRGREGERTIGLEG